MSTALRPGIESQEHATPSLPGNHLPSIEQAQAKAWVEYSFMDANLYKSEAHGAMSPFEQAQAEGRDSEGPGIPFGSGSEPLASAGLGSEGSCCESESDESDLDQIHSAASDARLKILERVGHIASRRVRRITNNLLMQNSLHLLGSYASLRRRGRDAFRHFSARLAHRVFADLGAMARASRSLRIFANLLANAGRRATISKTFGKWHALVRFHGSTDADRYDIMRALLAWRQVTSEDPQIPGAWCRSQVNSARPSASDFSCLPTRSISGLGVRFGFPIPADTLDFAEMGAPQREGIWSLEGCSSGYFKSGGEDCKIGRREDAEGLC